jgi:hypothetical protein
MCLECGLSRTEDHKLLCTTRKGHQVIGCTCTSTRPLFQSMARTHRGRLRALFCPTFSKDIGETEISGEKAVIFL